MRHEGFPVDVMRLAYQRYSSKRGFTPEQFRQTAEDVSGVDLKEPFRSWLASTDELDYSDALNCFGLQFAKDQDPTKAWQLNVLADASSAQQNHLKQWLGNVK